MVKLQQAILSSLLMVCSVVFATDLMDVYYQALESDPDFKLEFSKYMSDKEALPQALSALLPHAHLLANTSQNYKEVETEIASFHVYYYGDLWDVTAYQTLFNFEAWNKVKEARAKVKAALARFNASAQDLMMRTASAYFDVLLAIDEKEYAQSKLTANESYLKEAENRFKVGLDPITSVYEAKAAFDQATAGLIKSKTDLNAQYNNMSRITNTTYEALTRLRNNTIPLIRPEPANVDEWVNTSLKQNNNLYATKYDMQAARDTIKAVSSNNYPVFRVEGKANSAHLNPGNLANTTTSSSAATSSLNSLFGNIFVPFKQVSSSIALKVDYPLLQGGMVESRTREAQYHFQAASENLEKVHRSTIVDTQNTYNAIIDGVSKIKADRQTLISQEQNVESIYAQYTVGTRTMTDLVNAQEKLYQARTGLAKDQYDYIKLLLQLKYLAGTLSANDLQEVNAWLATKRINSFPKKA